MSGLALVGVVVVGAVALGDEESGDGPVDDNPEEEPALEDVAEPEPEDAPEDDIAEVNSAGLLEWESQADLGEGWPLAMVEFDDSILLFTSDSTPLFSPTAHGVNLWRGESNGTQWELFDHVIAPGNLVGAVAVGNTELLAVGRDVTAAPVLWRSTDGVDWVAESLPTDGDERVPSHVAAAAETLVVVGTAVIDDDFRHIVDALADHTGRDREDLVSISWDTSSVRLHGPFGLTVDEFSLAELGVSDDDLADPEPSSALETEVVVWSSAGNDWVRSRLPLQNVSSLTSTPDGRLVIVGSDSTGAQTWSSRDGADWQPQLTGSIFWSAAWQNRFLGLVSGGTTSLAVGDQDLQSWETIPLEQILDDDLDWFPSPVTAADTGVAVAVQGRDNSGSRSADGPVAILVKDGYSLQADSPFQLSLRAGDTVIVPDVMFAPSLNPGYRSDFDAGTITILDPDTDTDEELVTFTIDELRQLEREISRAFDSQPSVIQILYSSDAQNWYRNSLANITATVDPQSNVVALQLTDTQLIAVVSTGDSPATLFQSAPTPELSVYTAGLP